MILALVLGCAIPAGVIIKAPDPCWTWERAQHEYQDADARVGFARWLTDQPFEPRPIVDPLFKLVIVEHSDAWDGNAGLFNPWDFEGMRIDYAINYEERLSTLKHELGHYRAYREQYWQYAKGRAEEAMVLNWGWWHFGHGDFLDPMVLAADQVIRWFFAGLPYSHSYWPGLAGHPPNVGTPGLELGPTGCVIKAQ